MAACRAPEGRRQARGPAAVDAATPAAADEEPGNWMSYGRTYGEQHYSPLTKISADNVKMPGPGLVLQPRHHPWPRTATPIVVDGVMYIATAWSKVKAFAIRGN